MDRTDAELISSYYQTPNMVTPNSGDMEYPVEVTTVKPYYSSDMSVEDITGSIKNKEPVEGPSSLPNGSPSSDPINIPNLSKLIVSKKELQGSFENDSSINKDSSKSPQAVESDEESDEESNSESDDDYDDSWIKHSYDSDEEFSVHTFGSDEESDSD